MLGRFICGVNKKTLVVMDNDAVNSPTSNYPWITLCFLTPHFSFFKYQRNAYTEWYRNLGLDCPTRFLIHNTEGFWSLSVAFLGFGLYISYQNGY